MMELGCSSVTAVLKYRLAQIQAYVSLVFRNGQQGAGDVLAGLCVAPAADQLRHDDRIRADCCTNLRGCRAECIQGRARLRHRLRKSEA